MRAATPIPRRHPPLSPWALAIAASIAVPLGLIVYFLVPPLSGVRLDDAVQHFAITTNVSVLAAAVSFTVLRPALRMRYWPSVLVALGFMSLAGFFLAHGLTTPGVLLRGGLRKIAAASVIALAAQLALLVPALFFAARYTPAVAWLQRSRVVTPGRLVLGTAAVILAFDVSVLAIPVRISDMIEPVTGYAVGAAYGSVGGTPAQANPLWLIAAAGSTILLLAFAAVRQSAQFMRTRLPTDAALCLAFLFLAEAQVAAAIGPVYSPTFWSYHALMATATILAVGSQFVELDRRRGLERFLPPNVVERVIVGDSLSLEGERRTATILFSDLRGSTALAERTTPETAVATVNAYLRAMARAVIDEGGILDKFTGDGLMAIFGAMAEPAAGAAAAVRAAERMRRDIAGLDAERAARGEPTVGYGVGIDTGDVVLGAVGLPERSDYTAMGDTVNTAARMESLTKELGVDVVVSQAVAGHLGGVATLRPLGSATVKGKRAPVAVFTIDR